MGSVQLLLNDDVGNVKFLERLNFQNHHPLSIFILISDTDIADKYRYYVFFVILPH